MAGSDHATEDYPTPKPAVFTETALCYVNG